MDTNNIEGDSMPTIDGLQLELCEELKQWLRDKLGEDKYNGKIQVVCILANTITDTINLESCNIVLEMDIKKLLREVLESKEREQLCVALLNIAKGG